VENSHIALCQPVCWGFCLLLFSSFFAFEGKRLNARLPDMDERKTSYSVPWLFVSHDPVPSALPVMEVCVCDYVTVCVSHGVRAFVQGRDLLLNSFSISIQLFLFFFFRLISSLSSLSFLFSLSASLSLSPLSLSLSLLFSLLSLFSFFALLPSLRRKSTWHSVSCQRRTLIPPKFGSRQRMLPFCICYSAFLAFCCANSVLHSILHRCFYYLSIDISIYYY
jgi:hypothetical protein